MYSLEESLAYWNDAGRYGSIEERIARSKLWQPYYSYIAKQSMNRLYEGNAQASRTAAFMLRENILNDNDTLLDIGAGMGAYSVEFARRCASVTALDMDEDCLSVLRSRAAQCSLSNIRCINVPWEEYRESEKFDVTFSAMCPAICNQEELLRLESLTKRTACLLTVTRGSYEKCRMELMRQLPLKKSGGMVTEALHYYNVLYLMGRQPNIECWSEHFTTSASVESLVDRYAVYLKLFGVEESESVPFMRDFFEAKAVEGMVEDECQMYYALVYWNVPKNEKG
ncbi:MAG: class I SAM-dependent methyltransferase [Oscillospiraceae bacterium]